MRAIDVIRKVAPHARAAYLNAFDAGDELLRSAGITTPMRMAHFLAQVLHESGGLTVTFENMNYKTFEVLRRTFGAGHHTAALSDAECRALLGRPRELAERVYGLGNPKKARELGNTRVGDGYLFRGGGILQTTGGYNYRSIGQKCGVDFYGQPDLVCSAEHALKPALAEWSEENLNKFADQDDLLAISRAINIGNPKSTKMPNGYNSRKEWYQKVRPLILRVDFSEGGNVVFPSPPPVEPSSPGVEVLQKRLNELRVEGTPVDVDGDLGPKTVAAIKAFQRSQGLQPDGVVGPLTQAALDAAKVPGPGSPVGKAGGIVALVGSIVAAIVTFAQDHLAFTIVSVVVLLVIGYLAWRRR